MKLFSNISNSQLFVNTFTLTFIAEWGDRSQLATIVLAGINDVVRNKKLWLDIRVFLCPSIWYLTLTSNWYQLIGIFDIKVTWLGKCFARICLFFILSLTSGWCHPWWVSWPCRLYWRGSFGWGSHCQVLSSFLFFVPPCPLDYFSSCWHHNIWKLFLVCTFYV